MSEEIKVSFVEAEVTKLSLKPGDVLAVKITEDVDPSQLEALQKNLKGLFPNNKIALFCLSATGKIEFESISSNTQSDCSAPTSYCDDCSCGKKEQIEGESK